MQSMPSHPTSWRSILLLYSYLRLGLPSGLFPSGFHTKPSIHSTSPIRATCPTHLILLDFVTSTILGEYRSISSSLCTFLYSHVTSSMLGPNVLLYTIFSNTISLRSSLSVSDQVSHSYKTTGKITFLYSYRMNIQNLYILHTPFISDFLKDLRTKNDYSPRPFNPLIFISQEKYEYVYSAVRAKSSYIKFRLP
jgi:hypothetical protein